MAGARPGSKSEPVTSFLKANCAFGNPYAKSALLSAMLVKMLADFIILDNDIFTTPKTNISKINILKTFINGKVVYSR